MRLSFLGRLARGLDRPVRTLVMGDIVSQDTAAVVNAADRTLLGGTGVDGALHEAAGPELATAVRALGGVETGKAKATPGFRLPASFVIHTAAPVYDQSGYRPVEEANEQALACCFVACIALADRLECASIAFPALGAGAFGWPVADVARIAAEATLDVRCRHVREVRFVAFGEKSLGAFEAAFGIPGNRQVAASALRYHPGISATDH